MSQLEGGELRGRCVKRAYSITRDIGSHKSPHKLSRITFRICFQRHTTYGRPLHLRCVPERAPRTREHFGARPRNHVKRRIQAARDFLAIAHTPRSHTPEVARTASRTRTQNELETRSGRCRLRSYTQSGSSSSDTRVNE